MRRRIAGLHDADQSRVGEIPDGLFLARVERAQHRWHAHKPYYVLRFAVLEPERLAGHAIVGRLYCSPRALWKLNWFLRDFGYDTELLGRDEIDDKILVGLRGVVGQSRCRKWHFPAQPRWLRASRTVGGTVDHHSYNQ